MSLLAYGCVSCASNPASLIARDGYEKASRIGYSIGIGFQPSWIEETASLQAGDRTVLLKVHKDATAMYYEPVIESISEAGGDLVHVLEEKK